ncbi:hypothetical protein [Synechocystis sp. LKSZ1]|uniref:hypothetical protein n=1 Tax=Synechocystis sp. LKSZ1 TaxID=3144951 RepID=UPI00336BD53E
MKIPPFSLPQPSSDGSNKRLRRDRLWGALGAGCFVALLTGTVTSKLESALVSGLATIPACWGNHWWQERRRHQDQCYRYSQLVYDIQALELRLLELEHYEEQINQVIAVADTFSQRISDENQKLKAEHSHLSRQISALQNKRQELGQRFAELQPQKEQLEAELQELCQQIEITGNHKQEIEKNLIESTYNLKIIENTCYFIREELEQLHQEVLDRVQYREELTQSITSLEQQSQKTNQQLQSMLQQEDQLQTMLAQLEAQRASLEVTCGELAHNISTLQREEKILSESITEKQEEVQSMESCLTYLRQEYNNLPSESLALPFLRTIPPA